MLVKNNKYAFFYNGIYKNAIYIFFNKKTVLKVSLKYERHESYFDSECLKTFPRL